VALAEDAIDDAGTDCDSGLVLPLSESEAAVREDPRPTFCYNRQYSVTIPQGMANKKSTHKFGVPQAAAIAQISLAAGPSSPFRRHAGMAIGAIPLELVHTFSALSLFLGC
jgi:hypothetical protein